MNLYCTQENQQLLWNTISKVPQFQQLRKENAQACESLFKAVVEEHYEEIGPRKIQVSELRTWNKKSVQKMMGSLEQQRQQSFQPSLSSSMTSTTTTTPLFSLDANTTQTRSHLLEQKQNALNSQFQKRQDEYSQFMKKPQVEEIDFREKDDGDGPLDNVDNLLEHHMKEREYEHFIPPQQPPQQQQDNKNEMMDFMMKMKEDVQQDTQSMQGRIDTMQGTIDTMQGTIDTMQGTIDEMQGTIDTMQGTIDKMQGTINKMQEEKIEQPDYTFRANALDNEEEEEESREDNEDEDKDKDSTNEEFEEEVLPHP